MARPTLPPHLRKTLLSIRLSAEDRERLALIRLHLGGRSDGEVIRRALIWTALDVQKNPALPGA